MLTTIQQYVRVEGQRIPRLSRITARSFNDRVFACFAFRPGGTKCDTYHNGDDSTVAWHSVYHPAVL